MTTKKVTRPGARAAAAIKPTDEQKAALTKVADLADQGETDIMFGGLAGTGKTSCSAWLSEYLGVDDIRFLAPTNQAAQQQFLKGATDDPSTIHRYIYVPNPVHCRACPARMSGDEGRCHGRRHCGCDVQFVSRPPDEQHEAVGVDESSMVGWKTYNDLRRATPRSVRIWIGDHGQLGPITQRTDPKRFNVMSNPHIRLEEPHRTVADSPIIELAMSVRRGEPLGFGELGEGVTRTVHRRGAEFIEWDPDDDGTMVVCYLNSTRVKQNKAIRKLMGRDPRRPEPGDRVICRDGDYRRGVWNGMRGVVLSIRPAGERFYSAVIDLPDMGEVYEGRILRKQFNNPDKLARGDGFDLWDYSYCTTVHSAQGSEAKRVYLLDQSLHYGSQNGRDAASRWLYTAATRAIQELHIAVYPHGQE